MTWKAIMGLLAVGIIAGIAFTVGAKVVERYFPQRTAGEREKDGQGFPLTQKG